MLGLAIGYTQFYLRQYAHFLVNQMTSVINVGHSLLAFGTYTNKSCGD